MPTPHKRYFAALHTHFDRARRYFYGAFVKTLTADFLAVSQRCHTTHRDVRARELQAGELGFAMANREMTCLLSPSGLARDGLWRWPSRAAPSPARQRRHLVGADYRARGGDDMIRADLRLTGRRWSRAS